VRDLVVLDVVYLDWSWSPQTNKQTKQKWSEPASVEHNRACMHERVCVCLYEPCWSSDAESRRLRFESNARLVTLFW